MNHYSGSYAKSYFWRTTSQQEIDYIEEAVITPSNWTEWLL